MALFNKNKEDKKHKGENIVGKIIYIFLLFAPLFSILTTSLYTIFNKNAFESYYGQTINERQYENKNVSQLNKGYEVYYTNSGQALVQRAGNDLYISATNIKLNTTDYSSADRIQFYAYPSSPNSTTLYLVIKEGENTLISRNILESSYELTFVFENYNANVGENYINGINFLEITYNKYSYLDNSFDYGIYKTEENNLFNWAKNTGNYTIMKATTDGLEINNTFIPMLLTYWLIISVIYFIYDIALMLIWILHRKIHELTESV